MLQKKETSAVVLSLMLTVASIPAPLLAKFLVDPAQAQSSPNSAFSMPDNVPQGTKVAIDGSKSMTGVNKTFKENFEKQFPGTEISISEEGADAALKALKEGKIDLAAVGRPLTEQEKAQGLIAVPVTRHKIAAIVSSNNPFNGSINDAQFAKIFRGEITNWSEIGGVSAPIRVIDFPKTTDTRQAFQKYPVFRKAPFENGKNTIRLSDDNIEDLAQSLGKDGIGYAIVDRIINQSGIRVVPMYKTTPDNPKYPFSQPLYYVYKGAKPSAGVAAFLGYVTNPSNRQAIDTKVSNLIAALVAQTVVSNPTLPRSSSEQAKTPTGNGNTDTTTAKTGSEQAKTPTGEANSVTGVNPTTGTGTDTTTAKTGSEQAKTPTGEANSVTGVNPPTGTGTDTTTAKTGSEQAKTPNGEANSVTGVNPTTGTGTDTTTAKTGSEQAKTPTGEANSGDNQAENPDKDQTAFVPPAGETSETVPNAGLPSWLWWLPLIGLLGGGLLWLKSKKNNREDAIEPAESARTNFEPTVSGGDIVNPTVVPTSFEPTGEATPTPVAPPMTGAVAAGAAVMAGAAGIAGADRLTDSRAILVPRDSENAYAYWEISEEQKAALKAQGGEKLALRLHDVTDGAKEPTLVREYECDENTQDLHVAIPDRDRNYAIELGYKTSDNNWLSLTRSDSVKLPSANSTDPGNLLGSTALAGGAAAVATRKFTSQDATEIQNNNTQLEDTSTRLEDSENIIDAEIISPETSETSVFASETPTQLQNSNTKLEDVDTDTTITENNLPGAALAGGAAAATNFFSRDSAPTQDTQETIEDAVIESDTTATNIQGDRQPETLEISEEVETPRDTTFVSETPTQLQNSNTKLEDADIDTTVTKNNLPGATLAGGAAAVAGAAAATNFFSRDSAPTQDTQETIEDAVIESDTTAANIQGDRQPETKADTVFVSEAPTQPDDSNTKLQINDTSFVDNRSRIRLEPRDGSNVYANWEVYQKEKETLESRGGEKFILRLYDVTDTDITNIDSEAKEPQIIHIIREIELYEGAKNMHLSIPAADRDYVVELGYKTKDNDWLSLAKSIPLRVETKNPNSPNLIERITNMGTTAVAGVTAAASTFTSESPTQLQNSHTKLEDGTTELADDRTQWQDRQLNSENVLSSTLTDRKSRIVITAHSSNLAYAYWEIDAGEREALKKQGGRNLALRLYDVTDINMETQKPHNVKEYNCDEQAQDLHMSVPAANRDYLAELGYITNDGRWLSLAKSLHVRINA